MTASGRRSFSVEVVGFTPADRTVFASAFALSQRRAYGYVHHRDYPRRPDLFLVDADDLRAMVLLSALHPMPTHPAILIGSDSHGLRWPRLERPIRWLQLLEALDRLVDAGADARESYSAEARSGWPFVDRRARPRLDIDLNIVREQAP